jgi:3-oxoacyl-[acyl-carrier-protein] synthase II
MMRIPNTRVAITGLGVIAPNGNDKTSFWLTLLSKQSGIGNITLFDASESLSKIAGEVKNFDPGKYIRSDFKPMRMARHTQFAIGASQMALTDANIDRDNFQSTTTVPVVLGVSFSALDILEKQMMNMFEKGPDRVSAYVVEAATPQSVAANLSKQFNIDTQAITLSTACGAGLDAIATAADLIRSGRSDIAITGGSDAPITKFAFASFVAAGLTTVKHLDPKTASRPFDIDRETGVISEGCGILVLENLEHALARGARPYAEITGYGNSMDYSKTLPGSALAKAMRVALANAGLRPNQIDYISAHGPGHPILDITETEAIIEVLGQRAFEIPVSSIKGVIGNPLAAAGPLQVISCAQAFRTGFIPPTANLDNPDPKCTLDYVSGMARKVDLGKVMINSHGVGGGNSVLIIERFE